MTFIRLFIRLTFFQIISLMFLSIPELPVVTDSDHIRLLLIQSGFLTCSSYNLVNGGTLDQMSKDLKPDCIELTKIKTDLPYVKRHVEMAVVTVL